MWDESLTYYWKVENNYVFWPETLVEIQKLSIFESIIGGKCKGVSFDDL